MVGSVCNMLGCQQQQWQQGQAHPTEFGQQLGYKTQPKPHQQEESQQQHPGMAANAAQETFYSASGAALAMAHVPPSANIPKLQAKISDLRTALQQSDETCAGLRQQVGSFEATRRTCGMSYHAYMHACVCKQGCTRPAQLRPHAHACMPTRPPLHASVPCRRLGCSTTCRRCSAKTPCCRRRRRS
jgi:hypothetical protein